MMKKLLLCAALLMALVARPALSAWSFVTYATGTGASPTVDITGLVSSGDMLVWLHNGKDTAITAGPAGWTQQLLDTNSPRLAVFTKVATGSETTISDTGGHAGGVAAIAIYRYTGYQSAVDKVGTRNGGLATDSFTTGAPNVLVISFHGNNNTTTMTADAATTSRFTASGTDATILLADETKSAQGATTARTATGGGAGVKSSFAMSFRITNPGFFMFFP